ncbi:MAG: 1-(5-phosphoribosyl)-5-[(5-phosphoribosylamino)methylideneamino]imidazole-4-carboxamide isomerase [Gammaproteobacteria bacterium RIFCSPLOWO2_01_FULL_47_190]|jgi:phosphoribosylformimino-5-aminoimidazole carboxamide ribotide isomerase|nr:MAG: 1-(5-phosphoribosyl)-5-[(5-phosphoribosylamino)methylideneamino]imidazole-4-carboxamide isomerase [Gammaproteobacteria bacterium RIFCSPLOWO2_01_FULL_47_190]OGT75523.1 MAG: 1-(5-phosphoribosyl)-5-[(5-phosphoribosylamino)methylideneamino]imidazole-4-carboxamide isomerase [Gammaproteobacteria bacterium RIFCSPLOWO2_12_47_11]OGT83962.1 MAG: 1-(5-phosphoribosyl)-5-[(5-phosphoribosylamino)methylideneamino]imidazole-4-carboxamide isomerase [Gammaproteobacteria bacterium RIFCSPLOWO2_12_FULL_47_76]
MLLIPAIDIKGGRCVRLRQGQMDQETVYGENPLNMAERWIGAGARRLHIVDLDGAIAGKPENADVIHEIAAAWPEIPIQVGGGIRDEDTIQTYLDVGVSYVIVGTKAVTTPHFVSDICLEFPGHIIVGLDAKNGRLATNGWSKLSHHGVIDMAKRFEDDGVAAIIFTDIGRDGMMNSVNVDATVELCKEVTVPIIASGGITNMDDIRALCKAAAEGIAGAITGRAIYEGTLDFAAAQKLADELCTYTPKP